VWAQTALPGPASPNADNPSVVTVSGRSVPPLVVPASVTVLNREQAKTAVRRPPLSCCAKSHSCVSRKTEPPADLQPKPSAAAKPNLTLVMIDRIPVNDITNILGGSFDFYSLATDYIEQVEMVRGPLSSLSGSMLWAGLI
jgi:outer membrane receptor for ferrienterochelin and colicin